MGHVALGASRTLEEWMRSKKKLDVSGRYKQHWNINTQQELRQELRFPHFVIHYIDPDLFLML